MVGERTSLPTYQQVFGQDESDDDLDQDAKLRTSDDIQQSGRRPYAQDYDDDGRPLTGSERNPWREGEPYSPVEEHAQSSRTVGSSRHGGRTSPERRYSSGGESLELEFENEKLGYVAPRQPSWITRFFKRYVIPTSLAAGFLVIAVGAWQASKGHFITGQPQNQTQFSNLTEDLLVGQVQSSTTQFTTTYKSNGTALFLPTTILISLDGFRADFLQRNITPALSSFIAQGVSPPYMTPSFPSVTFPNHFTMVTGLYPESHGVVGNTFWDPTLQESFSYHDPAHSMQPKWWTGDPIWLTAERQGLKVATHMWPGSEAHIGNIEPTFVDKFNGSEDLDNKAHRILEYMDLPGPETEGVAESERPQLVLAYVPNVDADGHHYGPNSTEVYNSIRAVDAMLASLLSGLSARNLTDIVNVVIVSDHGMATTSTTRLVQLEDLIDTSLLSQIEGWPHRGLRLKDPKSDADERYEMLYNRLLTETAHRDGFDVYLRDKTMPERYHFSNNERIAPLWLIAKAGWAIPTLDDIDVKEAQLTGDVYPLKGIHGYDNEHPLMRAIFAARGPAFPHLPNSRVEVFQNTEVYNVVCDSVGVVPTANNGTLRLPFKPVGLHSDFQDDVEASEEDLGNSMDPPITSFIPQVSQIWNQLANATVASSDLVFITPGTPLPTVDSKIPPTAGGMQQEEETHDEDYDYAYGNEGEGDEWNDVDTTPITTDVEDELNHNNYDDYDTPAQLSKSAVVTAISSIVGALAPETAPGSITHSITTTTSPIATAESKVDLESDPHYVNGGESQEPVDFQPTKPVVGDENEDEEANRGWFGWFGDKFGQAKDWVTGLLGGGDADVAAGDEGEGK